MQHAAGAWTPALVGGRIVAAVIIAAVSAGRRAAIAQQRAANRLARPVFNLDIATLLGHDARGAGMRPVGLTPRRVDRS